MKRHLSTEKPLAETLEIIARIRKGSGMSQAQVADKIQVDATRISKIEKGIYPPSSGELVSILAAIETADAAEYMVFLQSAWTIIDRPSFDHPNREALQAAEAALQALAELRNRSVSRLVTARLDLLRDQIHAHADHVARTDYKIALIGEIGVGKTTALCVLADLAVGVGISDREILLETGPGRTTLCDVQVEKGLVPKLIVESHSSDDVLDFARDFCEGIWVRHVENGESKEVTGVPQEMDRALRNMSGLARPKRPKGKSGEPRPPKPQDPAVELAEASDSLESFVSAVWLRLDLARRIDRVLECPLGTANELEWLGKQFRLVNNGRHPRVSLPRLVRVVIPRPPIDLGPHDIILVDTKGLDSTLSRPDLREHRDDERTIVVVCTGFKDAPSASGEAFLRHGVEEGAQNGLLQRSALMVLPKFQEAIEMKDDSGYTAESVEDGYDLRREQVEGELSKMEVGNLPIWFVDATRRDDIQQAISELGSRLDGIVHSHVHAILRLQKAVTEAENNHEQQAAEAAHKRMRQQLRAFIERREELPKRRKPTQTRLLQDIHTSHQRTVWATARQRGLWRNLYAPDDIGAGAVVDARLRSRQAFQGLSEILENMLYDPDLAPAHEYVRTLLGGVSIWEKAFLSSARVVGLLTYRTRLVGAQSMWTSCVQLYGQGAGFRKKVARTVEDWFEEEPQKSLEHLADTRISNAWKAEVIDKLRAFVGDE